MNRRIRISLAWLVALAVLPAGAGAELGPDRWGTPGLSNTLSVPEGDAPPLRLGLWGSTATLDREHGIVADLGTQDITSRALRLHLSVKPSRYVVLAASAPYRFVSVQEGPAFDGFGDAEVSAAARFLARDRWQLGGWGRLRLPSGDATRGLSTEKIEGEYGLASTAVFFREGFAPRMHLYLNVGYRVNKNENAGYAVADGDPRDAGVFFPTYPAVENGDDVRSNDEILLRAAIEFRRRWGRLFLELASDWLHAHPDASFQESASWATPGVSVGYPDGPTLTAAWSIGLFADDAKTEYEPRLPDWQLEVGLSVPIFLGGRDRDDDGVRDRDDACPDRPEDVDGFEDEDGCPDDDNDGDGVPDRLDLAPNLAEDFDGFEDDDGRPEYDNDLDGIPDVDDECPLRPEDFDGFEDEDGCPDIVLDADADGIEDARDDCPRDPEDFDGFEDEDGCPDPDNDLDGIPDAVDRCPLEAEDYDNDRDDDGCPDRD